MRTLTSTFHDYHILQWNDYMASTFKIWFRRSRTILSDRHFKVIFNNIDNSILSAKNHKTWSKPLETLNFLNYSMLKPKHSVKYVCRVGTSASSTARAGTSCEMIRKKIWSTSSSLLTSFRFTTSTSGKVDHTVTATGRKKGITSTSSRISSRRNARRENSWAFTIGSFVMHDSERPWSNWVALKKWFARWRNWGTKTTHPHCHRRGTQCVPQQLVDPFEFWFRNDARKASSCFQRSIVFLASPEESRGSSLSPILVIKLFLVLVELAIFLVASLVWDITATMDPALMERVNLRKLWMGYFLVEWVSKRIWFKSHSDKIRLQPTQFTVTYGRCKDRFYANMATTKTTTTTWAMRLSVRPTTVPQSGMTRTRTIYMQLTKYNKYTNDDVSTDACVVHMIHWART